MESNKIQKQIEKKEKELKKLKEQLKKETDKTKWLYISELKIDPMECIGHGVSKATAESIRDYTETGKNIRLSNEDLELCRQWFCNVQDFNPEVLNEKDYLLAINIHKYFGMRISNSLKDGSSKNEN